MIAPIETRLEAVMDDRSFVRAMSDAIQRFAEYRGAMPLIPGAYTRTLLRRNHAFEIVAMLWAPGCSSPIHDHASSRCWVYGLEGTLVVENFNRLDDGDEIARIEAAGTHDVRANDLDHRLNWRELHRVGNHGDIAAYSLQLYAAPIERYTIVDPQSGRTSFIPSEYDARYEL